MRTRREGGRVMVEVEAEVSERARWGEPAVLHLMSSCLGPVQQDSKAHTALISVPYVKTIREKTRGRFSLTFEKEGSERERRRWWSEPEIARSRVNFKASVGRENSKTNVHLVRKTGSLLCDEMLIYTGELLANSPYISVAQADNLSIQSLLLSVS